MNIIISNSDKRPIYEQISEQIKEQILKGQLDEGEKLPSMRALAKELRISVVTSKRAYDELEQEGLIETVLGKGSFVASKNINFIREEHIKQIEALLLQAIDLSTIADLSLEDLKELLEVLYRED